MCLRTLVVLLFATLLLPAQEEARLLRFPHRQGDRIVFVKGGDLFIGSIAEGRATRLTSFPDGLEVMPRLSPDGRWVAFSAEYSGSRQIWLISSEGGEPRQLTFYPDVGPMPPRGGFDNLPYDWTPDGRKILVRMNRTPYGERVGRYYLVDPFEGGLERALAVPEGGAATFAPDGKKLAMNLISREWRTWKRYRAGRAQDVWIYDLERDESRRITSWEGTDSQPLWIGERIYFVSDRSGTLNLWVHDLGSGEERQITRFTDRDVGFPSRGKGGIVFECDGYVWTMDEESEEVSRLDFTIVDDRAALAPVWKTAAGAGEFDLSPEAKELLVEFRGRLFRLLADGSDPLELIPNTTGRYRLPRWSPDGKRIAFLAEVGDDYEVFLLERSLVDGKVLESDRQLTRDSGAWILDLAFAPDGKTLAITDKAGRLRLVDVETGEVRDVDRGAFGAISGLAWSADSSLLAYVKGTANGLSSVFVVERASAEVHEVSGEAWRDHSPAFDPEGRYLWFVSARDYDHASLGFEERVYGLLLRNGLRSPLEREPEEEPLPREGEAKEEKKDGKKAEAETAFAVDWVGLAGREFVLPLPRGRYGALNGEKKGLLLRQGGDLKYFDLEEREAKSVLEGVGGYRIAAKADKLAYRDGGKLCIAGRKPGQKKGGGAVALDGIRVRIEPLDEWRQMFQDAWRIVRDWFYDPEMHQVDWLEVRERYEPLLAHMTHRSDLDYVFGEMIAELNVGHAYVQGGEEKKVERQASACLGCELVAEPGGYRIGRIFAAENWTEEGRNPLREVGLDVREGDWIVAIDGDQLEAADNPYRLLEGKAGRRVRLTISRSGVLPNGNVVDQGELREVFVRPCASEVQLRYIDWVARNRARVEERSGGRIG